jgi:hypothetical protein
MGTTLGGSGLVAGEEDVVDVGETELEDVVTGESAAVGEGDAAGCRGLTAGCRELSAGGGAAAAGGSAATAGVSGRH